MANIGDELYGGIIIHIFQNGHSMYVSGEEHGIVVDTKDIGLAKWGCYEKDLTYINAFDPFVSPKITGNGYGLTENIINNCFEKNIAARLCWDSNKNGYNDWFLPSGGELRLLTDAINNKVVPYTKGYYWSSNESVYPEIGAVGRTVINDDKIKYYNNYFTSPKNNEHYVRSMRYF